MPTITRRDSPARTYGWIIAAALFGACLWLALPMMQGPGGGRPSQGSRETSLDALDAALTPAAAPAPSASGAYPHPSDSADNLPQGPAGARGVAAPGSPAGAPGARDAGASNLTEALKKVAQSGSPASASVGASIPESKKDSRNSAASTPKAPFSPPQANFGALSGLFSGGASGGSTSAGLSISDPAPAHSYASGASGSVRSGGSQANSPSVSFLDSRNRAMAELQNAQANAANALLASKYDAASGANSRSFDASPARDATLNSGAGGAEIGSLDAMPKDLKAADPNLKPKAAQLPKIDPKPVQDTSSQLANSMEQMIEQAAITGIFGNVFGSMGAGMAGLMGLPAVNNLGFIEHSDGSISKGNVTYVPKSP